PVTLYVRGDDYGAIQTGATQALQLVKRVPGIVDADMSFRPGLPEAEIRVDRARAADLGTSVGVVARTARVALEGDLVAKYREGDRDYDVRLQLAPEARATPATLEGLMVPGRGGALVRLAEVAGVSRGAGPATIERMDRQRQIAITANVDGRALGDVVADVDRVLAPLAGAGIRFVWAGQAEDMAETFVNMFIALVVAVLFIYMVLASQFESFVHPFTIMVSLPLAVVGALVLLWTAGLHVNLAVWIGIILLMGLVTKNAILLVDLANELRARGKGITQALLEAGPTRLRPILMTSAAMVLGMLPSAISRGEGSEFRAPMAIAVIGGVVASTFLTLVVVPVVYTWVDRFTLKHRSAATRDPFGDSAAGGDVPKHVAAFREDA
ncbi:MAG TPA: efflux RND transporter permease subunit, partial [Anaeromyxobacteraceae bacterium]|nr:efflux RND transporter permease subunit [Anaeromyxobacteraceae bacterium]